MYIHTYTHLAAINIPLPVDDKTGQSVSNSKKIYLDILCKCCTTRHVTAVLISKLQICCDCHRLHRRCGRVLDHKLHDIFC